MQTVAPDSIDTTVMGSFTGAKMAQQAVAALHALGISPDHIVVSKEVGDDYGQPIQPRDPEARGTNVAGGAATLATLGGLIGVIWGWASGASIAGVPGAVGAESAGILTSIIMGFAIGAAVGGLIGALVGAGMPALSAPEKETANEDGPVVVAVRLSGDNLNQVRNVLLAEGATNVQSVSDMGGTEATNLYSSTSEIRDPEAHMEATDMADEVMGRDPESVTGTRDAIDPETGALGTAGTPMTTGYGVSGSTIGTGSARGSQEQESGDFKGTLPDTAAYDKGGRSSDDAPDRGKSTDTRVEDKHTDVRVDEAPVQSEPETRDIYEAGASYATPTETVTSQNVCSESTNESAGTNIPGTADVRGLGDNTDEE